VEATSSIDKIVARRMQTVVKNEIKNEIKNEVKNEVKKHQSEPRH